MPTYQYECRDCEHQLEQSQNFSDSPLVSCPNCNKDSLFRVVTGGIGFFCQNRTVGIVAEKNSSRFSEDSKHAIESKNRVKVDKISAKLPDGAKIEKLKKPDKKPWYKQGQTVSDEKLKVATPEQQQKYIETGKM